MNADHNDKRLNSVLQYEAIYFNAIGDYKKEMEVYSILSESYKKANQLVNYGVTEQNLASLLLNQKNYDEAIIHYEEGLKYNSLNGPYFELAWCYYMKNDSIKCKEAIENGKTATKQIPVYTELLDWLSKMLISPNSRNCLSVLLKIENQYLSVLSKETTNFLYIALANTYKDLNELDKAYSYLVKVVNENTIVPLDII